MDTTIARSPSTVTLNRSKWRLRGWSGAAPGTTMGARASSAVRSAETKLRLGASGGAEHPRQERPHRPAEEREAEQHRHRAGAAAPLLLGQGHDPSIWRAFSAAGVPGERVMIRWSASRAFGWSCSLA